VISPRWRLALVAKALLLLGISASLFWIAFAAFGDPSLPIRALGGVGFSALGLFIAWAASLGLADAVLAQTRTEEGVRVLESKRRGYSMRTPSGRFIEFILWNPWGKLEPDRLYSVTYGRFSGVIVCRPVANRPTVAA
jgi:hypothetical protein